MGGKASVVYQATLHCGAATTTANTINKNNVNKGPNAATATVVKTNGDPNKTASAAATVIDTTTTTSTKSTTWVPNKTEKYIGMTGD